MLLQPKFGIGMHPYPAFQCTKFQGNWIIFCFLWQLSHLDKQKNKKTKDLSQFLKVHISEALAAI